ncbi:MAG: BlaI/MecI/CopY family transcriptional regulator [Cytophagia bacterium]|nr:MAG: BlaI/MecI/CopY family transcriptional regulator [Cytophagales bacterium]TAG07059.1 MAG: BlaI/MecI/CopY family transcriptional regulator [Cytophagia bacterium]TAG44738.1 MAG: BlaI/MecI/CopY family transcriptional regulator [Cytophagia bacterium]
MKELTKAEEQIMLILWQKGRAFVKDIIAEMPEPKPAYNTTSTLIRILEEKGFIGHEAIDKKTYSYFPLIEQEQYQNFFLKNFMGKYFSGSFSKLASFFVKENKMEDKELEDMKKFVEEELKDK